MKIRGFEIVSKYQDKNIHLPGRKTACSAGYDLEAAEESVLLPHQVVLVPTGLKVYMQENEYLGIHARSGFSIKNGVSLINGQGIIDADYYDNEENEGHIMIPMINHSEQEVIVSKGMRVAQGIFYTYLTADGDAIGIGSKRAGGMGSTGEV